MPEPEPRREAQAARILDAASEAIVAGDPDGTVRFWNAGAERLYGYSAEEMIGRRFSEVVASRDLPRGREVEAHAASGAPIPEFEARAVRSDGSTVEVSLVVSPIADRAGRLTGLVAIGRDIGARERADTARRQAQQRFAGAFCNAPIGMALVSLDGRFIDVNPALCELLGRTEEDLHRLTFQALTHPDDLEPDLSLLRQLVAGEIERYELEKRYLRSDGAVIWAQLCVSLVEGPDGKPGHFVSQIQDITESKNQELELRRLAAHLEDLSLRDPLTGVLNSRGFAHAITELAGGEGAGLILIDIDDLKRFNAINGRLEGDRELRELAALLRERAAELDVYRVGGDQFAVLLPGAGAERCWSVLDRLLGAVRASSVQLAVSGGIASCPADGTAARQIVARAEATIVSRRPPGADRVGVEGALGEDEARTAEIELAGVTALVAALEARDHYTAEHSRRVVDLTRAVAARLGLPEAAINEAERVAALHDIGKVAVPDSILQKPGPLTGSEWELMRQHPAVGERIVASTQTLAHLAEPIRAEHERFDGSGYPDGLAGEEIPIASRITLACDAYHAMTSERPYRPALSDATAREELSRCAGSQFDPGVIEALLAELGSGDNSA